MEIIVGGFLAVAFFALGVAFHKWVISEAETVKAHVTGELKSIRASLGILRDELAKKTHL